MATSYQNIAAVYQKEGKRAQAIEMATKAYDIKLKVPGPDHPSTKISKSFLGSRVAASHVSIGNVYTNQGKYEEALVELSATRSRQPF